MMARILLVPFFPEMIEGKRASDGYTLTGAIFFTTEKKTSDGYNTTAAI